MPSRKPTSSRGGHSKGFKAITKLVRFEHALARQSVQTSSSSSETTSEEEPSPAPRRRSEASALPRQLPPLYFYKTKSFPTGRKLPVPAKSAAKGTAARASEPAIGGRLMRATVVDLDSGRISRQRAAKKDYKDPKWPCCECGDERNSQMVAQGSGRCTTCFNRMRYNKYVKKQTALGLTPVDEKVYFLVPKLD